MHWKIWKAPKSTAWALQKIWKPGESIRNKNRSLFAPPRVNPVYTLSCCLPLFLEFIFADNSWKETFFLLLNTVPCVFLADLRESAFLRVTLHRPGSSPRNLFLSFLLSSFLLFPHPEHGHFHRPCLPALCTFSLGEFVQCSGFLSVLSVGLSNLGLHVTLSNVSPACLNSALDTATQRYRQSPPTNLSKRIMTNNQKETRAKGMRSLQKRK